MANVYWRGGAPNIAKVITLTIGGTIEAGDLFVATIGSKTLTYAAASTDAATVATGFAAAWNALSATTYPEFTGTARGFTALATSGGALTLTAKTAGVNATMALSTTEANGDAADDQTFVQSVTTAASGPNDWSVAANWSGGAVPVNSDVVYIENSATSILYGLGQSAVTLTGLYIAKSFTGTLGLPRNYSTAIPEYLDQYLEIGATTCQIGYGEGSGSGRIKIDFGSAATACTVLDSGRTIESGIPAVLLIGSSGSNALTMEGGDVGTAIFGGESMTLATADVLGGTLHHGAGTITTLSVGSKGLVDFDIAPTARTVTNCNAAHGARIRDRSGAVTWTNGIDAQNCEIRDIDLDLGSNRTVTVT